MLRNFKEPLLFDALIRDFDDRYFKYFDDIIITDKSKLNLENVDYENGVFIENNPYQIDDLYNANSKNVIRIRRNGDKYFYIDTKNSIKEYDDFIQLIEQELL